MLGYPCLTICARCEAVRHCRWVDEVVEEAPWVIDQAFIDKWQIDYVAHDDDPYASTSHDDVYEYVKSTGELPAANE
jgi:choline-phosphate cytidylyltransferase